MRGGRARRFVRTAAYRRGGATKFGFKSRVKRISENSQEFKYHDVDTAATSIDNVGVIVVPSYCLINKGTGPKEMLGREIVIKSITLRCLCTLTAGGTLGTTTNSQLYRFALVLDRQANGAAPVPADVWQGAAIDTPPDSVFSFSNLNNSSRFKIIKQWKGVLTSRALELAGANQHDEADKYITYTKKCHIPITYKDYTSGSRAITDLKENNIFLIGISTHASQVKLVMRTRLRYVDS